MIFFLYFQPFDHRGSFQTKLFAWEGKLTQEQAAQIAAAKVVIYDGSEAAVAGGARRRARFPEVSPAA
jgi:5-dehydro-2-deoxygluconokinase